MSNVPSSPEPFFTQYIPERFSGLPGFERVSSVGSAVFSVPEVGTWSFRLRSGQLIPDTALSDDLVVRVTVPLVSFEPIVVQGTERVAGLALSPDKQMLAFKALTLDAERAAQIRAVKGTLAFAVVDGPTTHRMYITPGSAEPNLAQPECEISCDADSFWGLQTGAQNPFELLMSGKLKIAGDPQIPMALSALFV
jgi:putative sterol carrier protein